MYKIVADSSCDLSSFSGGEFAGVDFEHAAFTAVPLTISTSERTYTDDQDLDCHEMLDYLAKYKDRSYTACPSAEQWIAAFEGADEIYVVTLTGSLSGTYNSACLAAKLYQEDHPEVKFCLIDSLTTGPELRLIVEQIASLKAMGKTMEELHDEIQEYMKHTHLYFSFQSLHNFAQNGRVNKVLAASVGMLGISILGTASEEGTITTIAKCRGDKKVLMKMMNEMTAAGFTNGKIRICHVENEALAQKFAETFQTHFPGADILAYPARGICSYYGERGGIIVACECGSCR